MGHTWILLWIYITSTYTTGTKVFNTHACQNDMLQITCGHGEILAFDSALYGRNSSNIARMCNTRYDYHCSFDAHKTMVQRCAGKQQCHLQVTPELFSDPCGEQEFLRVTYRCVHVRHIDEDCGQVIRRNMHSQGYIASPSYPNKYYRGAHCHWAFTVQPTQRIRFNILDFDLDLKRGSWCKDYVEIKSGNRTFFSECSRQGRQNITIPTYKAEVVFKSDRNSLPERGFFMHYEAIGEGCDDKLHIPHGSVEYVIKDNKYLAKITCQDGFRMKGTTSMNKTVHCLGSEWSDKQIFCELLAAPTLIVSTISSTRQSGVSATEDSQNPPLLGLVLGLMAALMLIAVLLSVLFYCYRKQRNLRSPGRTSMVQNNLADEPEEYNPVAIEMRPQLYIACPETEPEGKMKRHEKRKNKDMEGEASKKLMGDFESIDIRPYMDTAEEIPLKRVHDNRTRTEMSKPRHHQPEYNYAKASPNRKKNKSQTRKDNENWRNSQGRELDDDIDEPYKLEPRSLSLRGSRSGPGGLRAVDSSPSSNRRWSVGSAGKYSLSNSAPDLLSDELYQDAVCRSPPTSPSKPSKGLPPLPPRRFKREDSIGSRQSTRSMGGATRSPNFRGLTTQI